MPRAGPLSLFAALILIATAAVAADALRGLDSLLDFLHTDTVVAEATEIMKDGPQMALTEINNTTSSNESSTTSIDCPFNAEECCFQNTTTAACVSSVCATIVSADQESNTCADLVEALLNMHASNPAPKDGTQTSVPTAGSGSGSGSGTTNMPTADPTTEPTKEPTADQTTVLCTQSGNVMCTCTQSVSVSGAVVGIFRTATGKSRYCVWTLTGTGGSITISFSSFATEDNYDIVKVYVGVPSATNGPLKTLEPATGSVTVPSNTATLVLTSDNSVNEAKFEALVTSG